MPQSPDTSRRRFQLVLIKPSHYDDDGYVIQWLRAFIPSNSLAAVYGLVADARERRCDPPLWDGRSDQPPVNGASSARSMRNRSADQVSSSATWLIGRKPCSARIGQRLSRLTSVRLPFG